MLPRQRQLIAISLVLLALILHLTLCAWKFGGMVWASPNGQATQMGIVGWTTTYTPSAAVRNASIPPAPATTRYAAYWGMYSRVGVDLPTAATLGVALPLALLMLDAYLIIGWRHSAKVRRRICTNCGYDLRAAPASPTPGAKCPECGATVVAAA